MEKIKDKKNHFLIKVSQMEIQIRRVKASDDVKGLTTQWEW
jgi:hypothetical protein